MTPLTSSILARLDRNDVVFTTRRAAQLGHTSVQSAARVLQDMAAAGLVTRVTRGVWAITHHPGLLSVRCAPIPAGHTRERHGVNAGSVVECGD